MKNKREKQIKVYLNDGEYSSYLYLKEKIGLNMNQFIRSKILERYEECNNEKESKK